MRLDEYIVRTSAAIFGAGIVGIVFGLLSKHLPLRGWLALVFDLLTAAVLVGIGIRNYSGTDMLDSFSLFYAFLITAPMTGIYSIYAYKHAKDRWAVYGGVAGAVVINGFFVFFILGTVQLLLWPIKGFS